MKITFHGDELLMLAYALSVAEKNAVVNEQFRIADDCAELYKKVDDKVRSKWQRKTKSIIG